MSKNTITVVECPDQGASDDPESLGLAFHPRFLIGQIDISGQYGDNYQSQLRRSALSRCFV